MFCRWFLKVFIYKEMTCLIKIYKVYFQVIVISENIDLIFIYFFNFLLYKDKFERCFLPENDAKYEKFQRIAVVIYTDNNLLVVDNSIYQLFVSKMTKLNTIAEIRYFPFCILMFCRYILNSTTSHNNSNSTTCTFRIFFHVPQNNSTITVKLNFNLCYITMKKFHSGI